MLRFALTALLLCACFGSAARAQVSEKPAKGRVYFATEIGTKSVYRTSRNGVQWDETKVVTGVEETKRGTLVIVTTTRERDELLVWIVDGKPQKPRRVTDRSNDRYLLTADGAFWLGEVGDKEKSDDSQSCRLKLPPTAGVKWSFEDTAVKYEATHTIQELERIKVPAGTFEAIPVHCKSSCDGKEYPIRKRWYAEAIGAIKYEVVGDTTEVLMSIERPPQFARPASPEEIFKKAIAARGSKDGPFPNDMVHGVGEGTLFKGSEEIPLTVVRWNLGPFRLRTELTQTTSKGKSTDVVVFDRGSAWSKLGEQAAEPFRGSNLETYKSAVESEERTLQQLLDDKEVHLSMAGERFRDNEPCWCVRARRKGAPDHVYSFSKKTFLLKADCYLQKSGDGEVSIETVYADHRKVRNTLVPHKQEMFEDLQIRSRIILKKIEPIEKVDEKLLAFPK